MPEFACTYLYMKAIHSAVRWREMVFSYTSSKAAFSLEKGKRGKNWSGQASIACLLSWGRLETTTEMGSLKKMLKKLVKSAQEPKTWFPHLFPESSTVVFALRIWEYNKMTPRWVVAASEPFWACLLMEHADKWEMEQMGWAGQATHGDCKEVLRIPRNSLADSCG